MIGLASTIFAAYLYWETSKRYISIFLLFFLITGGFQMVPLEYMVLPTVGISKSYDWVFVFVSIIVLVKPEIILNARVWKDHSGVSIFIGIICLLLFYNLFHVGVEAQVALRVFRNYMFFILLLPFAQLKEADFLKVFRLLIYFTTLASFLYCLQAFLGRGILNGAPADVSNAGGGLMRFYNLPYYILPVIFTLFIKRKYFNLKFYYVLLGINILAVILSQHRNLIFSIPICYIIYLALIDELQLKKIAIYVVISAGVFIGVDNFFNNRFSKGLMDLSESSSEVTPGTLLSTDISDISTSEFRKLHFLERYYYAQEDTWTSLFGVGFLTEDAELVKRLSFNIGLVTEEGEVTQVDTSDIAWSLLIIHFGFIGILSFFYFYWSYVVSLYKLRREMLCVVGIVYVAALFISSFFGIDILTPHAVTLLMLIGGYCYVVKNVESKQGRFDELLLNYKL